MRVRRAGTLRQAPAVDRQVPNSLC